MFDRLGATISRAWAWIVVFWVLLAVVVHLVAPRWNDVTHDGDLAYLPDRMPSAEGERLFERAFPDEQGKSVLAVVVERPQAPLTGADLLWSDSLTELFRQHQSDLPIADVWNRNTDVVGEKLTSRISKSGQAAVTLLRIKNEFMATGNMVLNQEALRLLAEAQHDAPAGLNVAITGSAAVGGDMLRSAAESIKNTELTTVGLVILILLLVYRAPLLVSIPLVTIGVSLFVATDVLALLTQVGRLPGFGWWNFKIFTTTKIFIVVILFGAGTDFCLFLIARYKEELQRGLDRSAAAAEAVRRVGGALVASAMTTICGLGMMFFADFGKFRNSGPAIALCLAITLLACLTLAPALLRACGPAVFWPFGVRTRSAADARREDAGEAAAANRFWEWASEIIIRRPGLILLASLALLVPLGYQGLSLRLTYDFLNELDKRCPSVVGAELARRHFAAGEMSPVTVLALKQNAHFDQPDGEREIARLTKQLYNMPGIDSVRSISEPTGDRPGYFQPFRSSGLKKLAARRHKITKATFLTQVPDLEGDVARFDLVLGDEPFSPRAIATLNQVDDYLAARRADPKSPWHDAKFTYIGTTVGIRDLAQVTQSDQRLIQQLVVLSVLAVLMALVRRPLVCCYLIASVLLSYFVTIGVTQLYFSWLYGETFHGLDWKVPIFLFVILIAVGEDYNIYLVTRVLEEQRRHGQREGLRRAVARTGGIITSCGVIMAGTFISMMTGTLRGMLELGFALSLGVMLDTCVVRPILVPAFLALIQRKEAPRAGVPGDVAPPLENPLAGRAVAR
jgi:RND superfamily putative drug exporter